MNVTSDENLGRPVRVEWLDSGMHRALGWEKRESYFEGAAEQMTVETVGLWMGQTEEIVLVGQSRDDANDNWCGAQVIHRSCVRKVEWLA